MTATAPTEVFRPAGNTCYSDQPPASNDVESCSAPLRGLAIRRQKRAVLFPRRHGLPPCENCAFGALGGRQQRARFAHLGLRTASRLFCPLLDQMEVQPAGSTSQSRRPRPAFLQEGRVVRCIASCSALPKLLRLATEQRLRAAFISDASSRDAHLQRHQCLAAAIATGAGGAPTDRPQRVCWWPPVDRLVHRLCSSPGLGLLCGSRVLGAVRQHLRGATG